MGSSMDISFSGLVAPGLRRARLANIVGSLAKRYGVLDHVEFTSQPDALWDPGLNPDFNIHWNNVQNSLHVFCNCNSIVEVSEQLNDEQSLARALRGEILGRWGLRTLSPQDKQHFLEAINENRLQMQALWQNIDLQHPGKTGLDKAEEMVCLLAQDLPEQPSPQGHLLDAHSLWSEVVAQRKRPCETEDVSKILQYLVSHFRKYGVYSQKTHSARDTPSVPSWLLEQFPPNWTTEFAQIGDGNYEGWITEYISDLAGEDYIVQNTGITKNVLHRVSAFAGDTPLTRSPALSHFNVAIAYADERATCKISAEEQLGLLAFLPEQLPDGASIVRSSSWDANGHFFGPIIPLQGELAEAFVVQRNDARENTYFVHLAGDFDYMPQARLSNFEQESALDPAEIGCDGQGRMLAQPHKSRPIMPGQSFDLQIQKLQRKIPDFFDPQERLQVGQANTVYHGHIVAATELFVLHAAYPPGQSKAVPVIHWCEDFFSHAPHVAVTLTPGEHQPGRHLCVNYAPTGKALAALIRSDSSLYPYPTRYPAHIAPEQTAVSSSSLGKSHSTPDSDNRAELSVSQAAPQLAQVGTSILGGKTVIHTPQPGIAREGWVLAQDAQHIYLQLTESGRHVVAYPREAFAEGCSPEIDAHARIKIHYDGSVATAENRTLSAFSSNSMHARLSPRHAPATSNTVCSRSPSPGR